MMVQEKNPNYSSAVLFVKNVEKSKKFYNDILGQEIKTIFRGRKHSGKHYFRWDGTNYLNQKIAAGIDLYRMNTDKGHSFVGKMVLVK